MLHVTLVKVVTHYIEMPYFLEISLHLEIPPPSKCRRMFL